MGERAAQRAPVAHLAVGHGLGGLREQRDVLLHRLVADEVVVRRHGADRHPVALVADPAQLGNACEVDEEGRCGKPQPQHREQALPAREDLRVVTCLLQRLDCFVDRRRLDVVELGGDHWTSP